MKTPTLKPRNLFEAIAGLKIMAEFHDKPRTEKDYEFIEDCMKIIRREVKND